MFLPFSHCTTMCRSRLRGEACNDVGWHRCTGSISGRRGAGHWQPVRCGSGLASRQGHEQGAWLLHTSTTSTSGQYICSSRLKLYILWLQEICSLHLCQVFLTHTGERCYLGVQWQTRTKSHKFSDMLFANFEDPPLTILCHCSFLTES
jgi:hypothetical protein